MNCPDPLPFGAKSVPVDSAHPSSTGHQDRAHCQHVRIERSRASLAVLLPLGGLGAPRINRVLRSNEIQCLEDDSQGVGGPVGIAQYPVSC